MNDVFTFMVFQLKTLLYSWKMILILLLTPMLFLAGIGLVCVKTFKEESHVQLFEIAIVDKDNNVETKFVIQQLLENSHISKVASVIQVDEDRAMTLLNNNKIVAMIVIPKGFSKDVKNGTNTPVKVIGNARQPLESQLVLHIMESAAKLTSAAQSGINTIDHFLAEEDVAREVLHTEFKKNVLSFSLHILGRGGIYEVKEKNSLFQHDILQYYFLSFYLLLLMIWSFSFPFLLKGKANGSLRFRLQSRGITVYKEKLASLASIVICITLCSYLLVMPFMLWLGLDPLNEMVLLGTFFIVLTFGVFFMMMETLVANDKLFLLMGIGFIIIGALAGGHIIPPVYFPTWLEVIGIYTINNWALKFMFAIFDQSPSFDAMKILGLVALLCFVMTWIILKVDKRRFGW